ncbi:carbohydrate sulfotransferase 10-like [Palaemon carinicauda]|uniref:carbohydrate sulfotransferase 10-like n=1 Tax=Palaemon carinicauda TaxID=392227 RepID=UPI0035B67C13
MSLLGRVSWPSYRQGRVFFIILFGLIWFVNYEIRHESSADFIQSLQQSALKISKGENSSLQQETLMSFHSDNSSLQQETLLSFHSDNSSLQQETLKNVHSDNSSLFDLKSADSALPLGDNLQKPERVASEDTIDIPQKEGQMKENAVAQRLRKRRERLLEVCRREKVPQCHHTKTLMTYRMFFFHRYDTSVCTVAKSGSSTWRAHLRRVNKGPSIKVPIDEDNTRKAFLQRPIEAIVKDVNSSSLIITVRHPLTRLVSAYRDKYNDGRIMYPHAPRVEARNHKIKAASYWHERFHQFWLPALYANKKVPPDTHIKAGIKAPIDPKVLYSEEEYERLYRLLKPKVTFVQFLKYVLQTYKKGISDAHWKPYEENCCLCTFDYDYITKVETLSEDLEYIFEKIGIPANPDISKNKQRGSVKHIYTYFRYYRKVPVSVRRALYRYLKRDMDFFGYELPKKFLT